MADKKKISIKSIKDFAAQKAPNIDLEALKENAAKAGDAMNERASELKNSAMAIKEDVANKLNELDRMLEESITEYNDAYTQMNDKGIQLFNERGRSTDTIEFVEALVNSIANKPKSFEADFEEIETNRENFQGTLDFSQRELQAAREAAGGAGAGLAAGATFAFMGPSAAMWVATTFGTASTGTAISTLSGAAATNAALAWLGGGALSAGGGGMVAGNAFLAMAGPIGWSIAGASLLGTILLFSTQKVKLNKQKNEEIENVKNNTERIKETDAQIAELLSETKAIRKGTNDSFVACLDLYNKDYKSFSILQKKRLGALVNNTKALSSLLNTVIS